MKLELSTEKEREREREREREGEREREREEGAAGSRDGGWVGGRWWSVPSAGKTLVGLGGRGHMMVGGPSQCAN